MKCVFFVRKLWNYRLLRLRKTLFRKYNFLYNNASTFQSVVLWIFRFQYFVVFNVKCNKFLHTRWVLFEKENVHQSTISFHHRKLDKNPYLHFNFQNFTPINKIVTNDLLFKFSFPVRYFLSVTFFAFISKYCGWFNMAEISDSVLWHDLHDITCDLGAFSAWLMQLVRFK